MSNLKLQNTNYAELLKRLKTRKGKALKVGNNTEAILISGDVVIITYHDNGIVRMDPDSITFSNAGWGTSTTRTRLDIIAGDNNVPLWFGQKNFAQTLTARKRMWNGGERHLVTDSFSAVTWEREPDRLISLDGVDFSL